VIEYQDEASTTRPVVPGSLAGAPAQNGARVGPMATDLRLNRRAFLATTAAGLGALALAACGQAGAPAAPAGSAAAPASGQPAAGGSEAAGDWRQQWEAWIAGAKKEGTLVLATGASPEARVQVPEAFKKAFGVDIQYLGGSSSELANRLRSEQAANQYTVDVSVSGAGTSYSTFYAEKMVAPIKPYIINPEALDPKAWTSGKGVWYMDPGGEYFVRISNVASPQIVVNTEFMKPDGLNSWNDLLKPEYKGKAIALDPTEPGSGEQTGAYLYKTLGTEWVKRFYLEQQPALTLDDRVMADSVAHGKYPIAVGERGEDIVKLQSDGFKVAVLNNWPDGPGYVSAAFGLLGMFKNPPHPNAAKLFLNWILMKEGQTAWNSAWKTASVRKDVSNAWVPDFLVPKPGVNYFDAYSWDYASGGLQAIREQIRKLLADRPKG
jgi:iron(III) transport system substrate-binding protein